MPPSSSKRSADKLVRFVSSELKKLADPGKAPAMAAYMKTDSGFYGVQKPDRIPMFKEVKKNFKPASRADYEEAVLALWKLPYREEKYMALEYATQFVKLATPETMPLFENIVREGAWWDYVDVVASHLVGNVYLTSRGKIAPIMDAWVEDDDFWIRRTAILSQLRHKKDTDEKRLFRYCKARAHEKEFFIRKAIGWALREYSYTAPDAVAKFLLDNKATLSPLSFREGAKNLRKSERFERILT
jgi:Predicted DNA alkylation repair enzyme